MATATYSVPDQTGRRAIVTGANSGIGREIARRLADAGAEVTIAARGTDKGDEARTAIVREFPAATMRVAELDLADLASVARFAAGELERDRPLDLLIDNAGVMAVPDRHTTRDGFELQMGTNYLGHFALTGRLLPLLRRAPAARVVTMSSLAAWMGRINFDDLQFERSYNRWRAYGQSKLADLIFARELQRRGEINGWDITAIAAHPGLTQSNLTVSGPNLGRSSGSTASGGGLNLTELAYRIPGVAQTPLNGAEPALFAATSPDAWGGAYYGPGNLLELTGPPKPARVPGPAKNDDVARRLWDVSEQLTGVRFGDE